MDTVGLEADTAVDRRGIVGSALPHPHLALIALKAALVSVFCSTILVPVVSAQRASPPPISTRATPVSRIRLGMTEAEVHRIFGMPRYWLNLETDKYIDSVTGYRASVEVYGLRKIADVYRRRTPGNLYEIEIAYNYDLSLSRLNPMHRVDWVCFEADRPTRVDEVLKDIPEVGEACGGGCYVDDDIEHVSLVPVMPSKGEEETVAVVGNSPDKLIFQIRLEWPSNIVVEQNWLHQKITTVHLYLTGGSIRRTRVWHPGSERIENVQEHPGADATATTTLQPVKVKETDSGTAEKSEQPKVEPVLVTNTKPVYPLLAKQANIHGVVRLSAVVDIDGTVKNVEVVSGHPLLVPAALEALKQWKYTPALVDGDPVEVKITIEVPFQL
jgi:TonB family protein